MIVEIDDRAGLGPVAYRALLDRLNDGERGLVVASVRPGPCEARGLEGLRKLNPDVVLVTTSDVRSWEEFALPELFL